MHFSLENSVMRLSQSRNSMSNFGEYDRSRTDDNPPTVRLRTNSDEVTTRFKIKRAVELTQTNSKVRIVVKMRGKEKAHPEDAEALLQSVLAQIVPEHARLISNPESDGSQITCTIAPIANPDTDNDKAPNAG